MFDRKILKSYINGKFIENPEYFNNINPVDGTIISQISEATPAMVNSAVNSAKQALSGEWGALSVNERCALLHKVADRMFEREDEFIAAEIADTGKSLFQVKTIDIPRVQLISVFLQTWLNLMQVNLLLQKRQAVAKQLTTL